MTDCVDVSGLMEAYVNGHDGLLASVPRGLCQGGCQTRHRRLTTDGITCEECGAQTPLGFGQSAGRKEFEKEKAEFREKARSDYMQHITVDGTMTRVVHCPPTGNCRVCLTRSIERIAENRVTARFVCELAARRKARFDREASEAVESIVKLLTIHTDICKNRRYRDGRNALNVPGKAAVREVNALVAIVYDLPNISSPDRQHALAPSAPAVCGLEDADSDMEIECVDARNYAPPESPTPVAKVVRSEGKTIDRLKKLVREQFESVANEKTFLKKLEVSINACTALQHSHDRVGSAAATFLLDNNTNPGTLDPMVKALTAGTSPGAFGFATPELHSSISIRKSTCVQSIPEAMLESMVEVYGAKHTANVVCSLASSVLSHSAIATVIAEHASDKRLLKGAVGGTSRRLLTSRRMCCDDAGCKRAMCVGLLPFSSVVKKPSRSDTCERERATGGTDDGAIESATDSIDAMWTVQTRLLGGFAVCLSKRPDLMAETAAVDLVKKASKELFVSSPFFSRRVSEFVNAATALVTLHDRSLFDTVDGRQAAKHDLSVQSLAITLGFWPKYFQPCFEEPLNALFYDDFTQSAVHRSMARFVEVCTLQHASFVKEKGNATVDATLMYRRIQYARMLDKHKDRLGVDRFAKTISVGDYSGLPFPTPPPELFKSEVKVDVFAMRVADCLSFTRSSARAGSSRDNALVRMTERTSLSFDALSECTRNNVLGRKYVHHVEAGLSPEAYATPDLADAENGALNRKEESLAEIKTRAANLNTDDLMTFASAAAERVEATIPGFWAHTWRLIPDLALFSAAQTRELAGYHPAAGLFKRLDGTQYQYERGAESSGSTRPSPVEPPDTQQFSTEPFANPDVQAAIPMRLPTGTRATKAVQELIDMEVALSVLMHGTCTNEPSFVGSVVVDKPSTPEIDRAVSALAQSGTVRTNALKLIDQSFLRGLLSFCDSLVTRAMETEIRNSLPSQTRHDCPVMQCALKYFDEDAYARRAYDLHTARLERAVARAVCQKAGPNALDIHTIDVHACRQRSDRDHEAMEYLASNQAQDDVYEYGEKNRPTYSGQKRACLSKNTVMIASAALNGYRLLTLLAGREWVGKDADVVGDLSATAASVETRLCIETGDSDGTSLTSSILYTLEQFGRQKKSLANKTFGYSESSGARTKVKGHNDTVGFLTRPFHPSFFEGLHWNSFDHLLSSVHSELSRIRSDAVQDFVVVRAIERSAANIGEFATASQRRYRASVQTACEERTKEAKAKWGALDPSRKTALEAIAASLTGTQVAAFDLFCMRGVAGFITGALPNPHGADPMELFLSVYCRVTNTKKLTPSKKATCGLLFAKLQHAIVMLNTNRTTLSDVTSFYRHRIFVQFLCEAASEHGTITEQREGLKILSSGFCFLKRTFGLFGKSYRTYQETVRDAMPIDPSETLAAATKRVDEEHLERLAESRRQHDEAEERVANARFLARTSTGRGKDKDNGTAVLGANARRDAVRLAVGDV